MLLSIKKLLFLMYFHFRCRYSGSGVFGLLDWCLAIPMCFIAGTLSLPFSPFSHYLRILQIWMLREMGPTSCYLSTDFFDTWQFHFSNSCSFCEVISCDYDFEFGSEDFSSSIYSLFNYWFSIVLLWSL